MKLAAPARSLEAWIQMVHYVLGELVTKVDNVEH